MSDGKQVPALAKMDQIIRFLETSSLGYTLAEISQELDIPKTTVFRILGTLTGQGYTRQLSRSGHYVLGYRFLMIARTAEKQMDISRLAGPWLRELCDQTAQTIKLSVFDGRNVVVLRTVESDAPIRIHVESGSVYPLHAGAASKILLAHLPEKEKAQLMASPLKGYTSSTLTDKKALNHELKHIQEQGYALDNEEFTTGICALAAPVFNSENQCLAAVSIPYAKPDDRDKTLKKLLPPLMRTTGMISREFGYSNPYPDMEEI